MRQTTLLSLLIATAALGQQPAFDVASIRIAQRQQGMHLDPVQFSPDSLTIRGATLKTAISWAYHVMEYQVQGPEWLNADRYDIVAKAAAPVPEDQLRVMLQTLLADRFKVTLHRQTKVFQAYLLTIGKNGPKFQESKSEGASSIVPRQDTMSVTISRTPLSQLTDMLSKVLQTPVVDMTGLTGRYDITLNLAKYLGDLQPSGGGPPDVVGVLLSGVQEELGLKLESKKTPLDLLIIDSAEKIPAEN
jgi:uncharacterized protein (TIGR03435 family)